MSLFVANLAFVEGTALETLAILVASLVSGLAGAVILRTSSKL
jgi:Na+/H+ antiporter NhaA